MDIDTAISMVTAKTNRLRSLEADFEKQTWTFGAPYMVVGAGEYVVIPHSDWAAFINNLRTTTTTS